MNSIFEKVLFVGPANEAGGMGTVLGIYARHIYPFKSITLYKPGKKRNQLRFFLKRMVQLVKLLWQDKQIRILHVHSASGGSFIRKSIVGLVGKIAGRKVVFHIHSGAFDQYYHRYGILKPLVRRLLYSMDRVVCLTEQWYMFYTGTLHLRNVVTIGNPVEIPASAAETEADGVLHLLFLGKICDEKGIFGLIEYLKTNTEFLANRIQLVIGGSGETERLNRVLKDIIFQNRITYRGWVQGDMKNKILSECDVYILPSYFEGLPVSILEAMAYGKPIIATNVGGIPSIVRDDYNGWLFNAGKFNELDAIFNAALSEPARLSVYRNNSRSTARLFAPQAILSNLEALYHSLL